MTLTVIVLTLDEADHLARAIRSVAGFADRVLVVDSGSADTTVEIAKQLGVEVLSNPWRNHATQFNWALEQLPSDTDWVMRLDADEIVTPDLANEIAERLPQLDPNVEGVYVSRRMSFMNRPIRHGGVFPIQVLRLFRYGRGRCENRWMDEHICVRGDTVSLRGELLDDSLRPLGWWTAKHNRYASREVVDLLNREYGFAEHETIADLRRCEPTKVKRWMKERLYTNLPGGVRAGAYFVYRYVLMAGFLDGREGAIFHVLQGFWYRFLVDCKLYEVKKYMRVHQVDVLTAIDHVLEIRISQVAGEI